MSELQCCRSGPDKYAAAGGAAQAGELLRRTRITPLHGARWQCNPAWEVPPRYVDDCMWYRPETGCCEIAWGERLELWQRLRPGDLALIPRGVRHAARTVDNHALTLDCAHFQALLDGVTELTGVLELAGVYRQPQPVFAAASSLYVREVTLQAPGWEQAAAAAVRQVLLEILRQTPAADIAAPHDAWPDLARLQPVFQHIDRHLANPTLRVADLARTLQVSEPWLRKLFQHTLHQSPLAVLRQRRIGKACQLLDLTELPIKEIADRCGLPDPAYFHRTFRDLTGVTPVAWRQQRRVNSLP